MSEWINDHPVHAPQGGKRVWIAHETVHDWDGKRVFVSLGYFCPGYRRWCFDNGTPVAKNGEHVLGWQPCVTPEWADKAATTV